MNSKKIKTHWNERWVPVTTKAPTKNYDYEISNYGRIKRVSKEHGDEALLKGSVTNNFISLNLKLLGGVTQGTYVHKFVATNFIKKRRSGKEILSFI